jgi:hypothetical protein
MNSGKELDRFFIESGASFIHNKISTCIAAWFVPIPLWIAAIALNNLYLYFGSTIFSVAIWWWSIYNLIQINNDYVDKLDVIYRAKQR